MVSKFHPQRISASQTLRISSCLCCCSIIAILSTKIVIDMGSRTLIFSFLVISFTNNSTLEKLAANSYRYHLQNPDVPVSYISLILGSLCLLFRSLIRQEPNAITAPWLGSTGSLLKNQSLLLNFFASFSASRASASRPPTCSSMVIPMPLSSWSPDVRRGVA